MIKGNRGQLSIFMGITLLVVMSMLAFIINVGLFVKAKINLQNAVDAAAFSGAATQARQLTNIAYANWELRNTYKEWMFKYYVLGQLGLVQYNLADSKISGKQKIDFLLPTPPISGFNDFDKYNVPSICIHNNSSHNICPIYALPGIPRFPAIGVAGISEIHEAFVNSLVATKGKDCSERSKINFLAAMAWAYGSGGVDDSPDLPLIATNRAGAWPEALEIAMRIRNLEMIVNRPAIEEITRKTVDQLGGQAAEIGFNERPIKAFWSAYRNLSGGAYKDRATAPGAQGAGDELSLNLKLKEIPPQAFNSMPGGRDTVSSFLIPANSVYPSGSGSPLQKQYLDLQLMPVNLATMFTTFVSTSNTNASLGGVQSEATCGVSKSAMPVPGYILGFNKNPEVLTYYAVKAESKFIGLFFPVNGEANGGIKLTAYAAAKPFGGRIGPKLFSFIDGDQTVEARDDINKRSSSYINGLKIELTAAAGFKPGMPIPSSSNFWVNDINPIIGGVPGTSPQVFYGIPNMIYDFTDESDLTAQRSSSGKVQVIAPLAIAGGSTSETLGLYHAPQYKALRESIPALNPGTTMPGEEVMKAIVRARRPTKYDAINYLIPDFREVSDKNNAAPMVQKLNTVYNVGFVYKLFAPLRGPNLLYKTNNDIESVVIRYMDSNNQAVEAYLGALLDVANNIYNTPSQGDTKEAARTVHINAGTSNKYPDFLQDDNCKVDMASKFNHFFRAKSPACGLVPIRKMMIDFIDARTKNENGLDKSLFYVSTFYSEAGSKIELKPEQLMSAYFPGPRQGTTGAKALTEHPLGLSGAESYSARRNYYSTKFFHMAKVIDGPSMSSNATKGRIDYQDNPALRESLGEAPADLVGKMDIKN
ncbi:MAG: Tad domain-containing protein, partial [Bacteriovorax sp.]